MPLRNLHWNSSTRPLRSIKSLHVELVSNDERQSQLASLPPSHTDLGSPQNALEAHATDGTKSSERPTSSGDPSGRKERRHQIPGLRQTPYLKIFLLRCEDIDSYKTVARKPLQEWVKEHSPPSQKSSKANNQENHDAYEWLILHVISPEGNANQTSSDRKATSKRDPSQLVEKIRADFNGTSKAAIDRVAQVQINEGQPGNTPLGQNPQDGETGWGDLTFKLKSLILASFDLRVRQYEEDLKEKESQRSLPGWNFNTFFVLKEGLAKGFESVGLVEDALTSYHELSVGLQSVLEGQERGDTPVPTANSLHSFTEELLDELKSACHDPSHSINGINGGPKGSDERGDATSLSADLGSTVLHTARKPFQELILANQISAFDFQCYIFARQVALLSRLANVNPQASGSPQPSNQKDIFDRYDTQSKFGTPLPRSASEPENLLLLAELSRQAMEFIVYTSRTMRNDLYHAADRLREGDPNIAPPGASRDNIIDNLVASWTCSVVDNILEITLTQTLSTRLQPLLRQLRPYTSGDRSSQQQDANRSPSQQQQKFPERTSSLSPLTPNPARPPSPEKFPSVTSLDTMRLLPPGSVQSGSQDLAAIRADLMFLKRRTIGKTGYRCLGWQAGWSEMMATQAGREDAMQDVSLDEDTKLSNGDVDVSTKEVELSKKKGLRNAALRKALVAEQAFYEFYESLTASTLVMYVLGERKRSAEAMTADIAAIRYQLADYAAAAAYFRQLAPFYAKGNWTDLELTMLHLYAQCLRKLERNEEYVGIALKILAKQIQRNAVDLEEPRISSKLKPLKATARFGRYLEDAVNVSKTLEKKFSVPIENYFGGFMIDPRIRHMDGRDGFSVQLRLCHILQEQLQAQKVSIRLVSTGDDQRSELWVSTLNPPICRFGWVTIHTESLVMQPGIYELDKIIVKSGNILFQHDVSTPATGLFTLSRDTASADLRDAHEGPRIHVYPQPQSLEARAEHCKDIHLEETRSIVVALSSGWNSVSMGQLSVRAGTAGLRLHTAEAQLPYDEIGLKDRSKPGLFQFGQLAAESEVKIQIPYTIESDLKEITVRLEVTYTTGHGDFTFACAPKIPILLPVGVNVQDIFSKEALMSKFSIFTANAVPLQLLQCNLEDTNDFAVQSPPLEPDLDIFARQPISLLAKVTHKDRPSTDRSLQRKMLLKMNYTCVDEAIATSISKAFTTFISTSSFSHLSRLLLPVLQATHSIQDLETAALLRSITLPPFHSYPYPSLLSAVSPQDQQSLLQQLRSFHAAHASISLATSASTVHTLTVPVEIPTLSILYTASLSLPSREPIPINTAVPAELRLSHTRLWGKDPAPNAPLDFVYEVSAPADTWLVGGQRRAHFSAHESQNMTFALLLLPQRTGHLLYPAVEVRHVPSTSKRDEDGGEDGEAGEEVAEEVLSCETDYKSSSLSVLVVGGLQRTTVAVDQEAPGKGAWMLETKRWGET